MHYRPYATGAMFKIAVLDAVDDPPGLRMESAPTLAAADLEVATDKNGGPAECSAQYTTFTSGSEEPSVGDTLTNNSQTAVYIGSVLTSGTWAGGDAAGYMFHAAPSGAFASGAIGISGGTADVATASGAATDAAGVFDEQLLWIALTAAEMTCQQGLILVRDATSTPVWADDAIEFETVGSSGLHTDVIGDLDDAAATGAVTTTDTLVAYIKQLVTEGIARDTAIGTAQTDLDTLTGSDGVTLATSQPNYAPATAAALSTHDGKLDTAQADLDVITGSDGATLATTQGNYAPAVAGDEMDLVDAPNATGITAFVTAITGSALFTGITSLAEWLGAMAGKQASDATAQTEMRATGAGSGTYDATTDSQEATRVRGDAAWAGTGATAGDIADAVLDEALSGHTTAGTLGKAIADIESDATAILADTADMQPKLGTPAADVSADIAAVKSDSAAILTDTADIQPKLGTPAADLAADIAAVKAETALIVADTNELQSDDVPTLIAALPTAAENRAEMDSNSTQLAAIVTQRSVPAKNSAFTFNFKMVDATDFATPETGLTVTATRSLDGASFGSATGTVTEIGNGMYQMAASAGDMNGNTVTFRFTATGAAPSEVSIITDGGV